MTGYDAMGHTGLLLRNLAAAYAPADYEGDSRDRVARQRADDVAHRKAYRGRERTNVRGDDGKFGGVAETDYTGCVGCITEALHGVISHRHHLPFEHDRNTGFDAGVVSAGMYQARPRSESYDPTARANADEYLGRQRHPVTSTRVRPSDYDEDQG
jgi:hypothetical protein